MLWSSHQGKWESEHSRNALENYYNFQAKVELTGLSIEEFDINSYMLFYVFLQLCLSDQDAMDEAKY